MKFNEARKRKAFEVTCAVGKILLNMYRYTNYNEEYTTFEDFVEALESVDYKTFEERSKVKYDYS